MFPRPVHQRVVVAAPPGDPFGAFVVLLARFNGVDAGTTFIDDSTYHHTLSAVGAAQLDTAQKQFGTASYLADGSTSAVNCGMASTFGEYNTASNTTPFTIESFVRFNSLASDHSIGVNCWFPPSDGWLLRTYAGSLDWFNYLGTNFSYPAWSPATGRWYYVCAEFDGAKMRLYTDDGVGALGTNAVMRASVVAPQRLIGVGVPLGIGSGDGLTSFGRILNGWQDEVRYTNGAARYHTDTSYPVPVAEFPTP